MKLLSLKSEMNPAYLFINFKVQLSYIVKNQDNYRSLTFHFTGKDLEIFLNPTSKNPQKGF